MMKIGKVIRLGGGCIYTYNLNGKYSTHTFVNSDTSAYIGDIKVM